MAIMGGFSIRMGYNKINRTGAANGDKGDIAYGGRHLDIGGGSDCICSDGAFGEMDGAISAQNQFWTDHPGSRTKVASKEKRYADDGRVHVHHRYFCGCSCQFGAILSDLGTEPAGYEHADKTGSWISDGVGLWRRGFY